MTDAIVAQRTDRKSFPACFATYDAYIDWRRTALRAKEAASPCSDCSPTYRTQMLAFGLCHEELVRTTFVLTPSQIKQRMLTGGSK